MFDKLKNLAIGIIVLLFFSFLFFDNLIADYTWEQTVIDKYEKDGWEDIYKSPGAIDITHPWTIFKKPIAQIWFYKNPTVNPNLSPNFRLRRSLLAVHENLSSTDITETVVIVDCSTHKRVYLEKEEDSLTINLSDPSLTWYENVPETPGRFIEDFLCR